MIGLVKSAALELGEHGITVNAVCPTAVDTPLFRNPAVETGTWSRPARRTPSRSG